MRELSVVAVGLTVQLVQHVCHCDSVSNRSKTDATIEEGRTTHFGCVARSALAALFRG